jgi:hypothetical protein
MKLEAGTMNRKIGTALVLVASVVVTLLAADIGSTDDFDCIESCKEESGAESCHFDTRQAERLCREDAGCEALRDTYAAACLGETSDEATCDAARASLRECVRPCRESVTAHRNACHEMMADCVRDVCGLEPPAPCRGPHARGRNRN